MAFDPIQCLYGTSMPKLLCSLGTEAQRAEAVKSAGWPDGSHRPRCHEVDHHVVFHRKARYQAALAEWTRPMYLKLHLVSGFTRQAVGRWAKANPAPGTVVTSGGIGCFAAVSSAGCIHMRSPSVQMGEPMLGNLKDRAAGAFHTWNYRKYVQHYFVDFAYRFDRRFDLRDLVARLFVAVARVAHFLSRRHVGGFSVEHQ